MTTEKAFLRPLLAFRHRRAYANVRGDLLVPVGTAAFMGSSSIATAGSALPAIITTASTTNNVDSTATHATVMFEEEGIRMTIVKIAQKEMLSQEGPKDASTSSPITTSASSLAEELEMAKRLDALGWVKVRNGSVRRDDQ